MQVMRRSYLLAAIMLLCSFHAPQGTSINEQVARVAESQLPIYLSKINGDNLRYYGFNEDDKVENCVPGRPYRMLAFNSDFYAGSISDDVNYLEIQNEWKVPVKLEGQNRSLLTIAGSTGNLNITSMGDTALAKDLQAKSMRTEAGDVLDILRINILSADILVAERDNSFADAKFIPLATAIKAIPAMGANHKISFTLEEVEQMVKTAIAQKQSQATAPAAKKKATKAKKKKEK